MKKFLLLFFALSLAAGELTWQRSGAEYRLILEKDIPGEAVFLDLRRLILPVTLDKGLDLVNEEGVSIPWYQHGTSGVTIPTDISGQRFVLYFGFDRKQKTGTLNRKKQKPPQTFRLLQSDRICSPVENPVQWQKLPRGPMSRFARKTREYSQVVPQACLQLAAETRSAAEKGKVPRAVPNDRRIQAFETLIAEQMEQTLFDLFRNRWGKSVPQIFFHERPFDTEKGYASLFHGRLFIPEKGRYCFKINCNSTGILRIDGKTLSRSFGEKRADSIHSIGSNTVVETELTKGSHAFEFLYAKGLIADWASVLWKRKEDPEFRLLQWTDFVPAPAPKLVRMESKKGRKYPLILRNDSLLLHTGKSDSFSLDRFEFAGIPAAKWHWELGKERFEPEFRLFPLKNQELRFVSDDPDTASLSIKAIPSPLQKISVYPDAGLKIYAPHFLFDDEYGTLTLELASRLAVPSNLVLSVTPEKPNPVFPAKRETLQLPGIPPEQENKFAGAVLRKQFFRIEGKDVPEDLSVRFSLALPGLELDRKGFRIVKADALPAKVSVCSDGITDGQGNRLLTILHRKSLHEVRKWELPSKVRQEFSPVRRLLVLAEGNPCFRQEMETAFHASGVELEFIPWKESLRPSGSRVMNTIPEIMEKLSKTSADTALIIPPSAQKRGNLGAREEINLTALLVEQMEKRRIRVFLSSPFPVPPEMEGEDDSFIESLRNLRREKGIAFLETEHVLKTGSEKLHIMENGIRCELPEPAAKQCVHFLKSGLLHP